VDDPGPRTVAEIDKFDSVRHELQVTVATVVSVTREALTRTVRASIDRAMRAIPSVR
jgi:hypothetical protein